MKSDWLIWVGIILIGLNLILFGYVYLQEDTFFWYYRFVLGGAIFGIGVLFVADAFYILAKVIVKKRVL